MSMSAKADYIGSKPPINERKLKDYRSRVKSLTTVPQIPEKVLGLSGDKNVIKRRSFSLSGLENVGKLTVITSKSIPETPVWDLVTLGERLVIIIIMIAVIIIIVMIMVMIVVIIIIDVNITV
jgi:hypothetical protein